MSRTIGIDLGTTNSAMASMDIDGRAELITNAEGDRITPSVVAFDGDSVLVGKLAKQQAAANPDNTVFSIKRHMGDPLYKVRVAGKEYRPQEISALILRKLVRDAEAFLGEDLSEVVITVPAYFNSAQKAATKEAGEIAGLKVERILDEPTAAAMAYGMENREDEILLVFDFGGGTLDVSVLRIVAGHFSVIATSGDNHLGGNDFDERIVNYLADSFFQKYSVDLRELGPVVSQRLYEAAEEAKRQLSSRERTRVSIPFIVPDRALSLDVSITRQDFEALTDDLVRRTEQPVRDALEEARLHSRQIDTILLSGGSSRIPRIRSFLTQLFGKRPESRVNPDECVALGAAIAAEQGTRAVTFRVSRSIGVEVVGGGFSPILRKGATLPTAAEDVFTTAHDQQRAIHFPIYQGEAAMAKENELLGEIRVDGLSPGPAGKPQVVVTFEMDTEGLLHCTAIDRSTNKKVEATLRGAVMTDEEKATATAASEELAEKME